MGRHPLDQEEWLRRFIAYEMVSSDRNGSLNIAARLLGISKGTMQSWRETSGLPSLQRPYRLLHVAPPFEALVAALEMGGSDSAAACLLGVSKEHVRYWREVRGLPPQAALRRIRHPRFPDRSMARARADAEEPRVVVDCLRPGHLELKHLIALAKEKGVPPFRTLLLLGELERRGRIERFVATPRANQRTTYVRLLASKARP